ncbi:MAG TPA: peptidyl-prolyl cis-trans isomerase [Vicinamibacterales bacterium]|nr:peptidyl-prolyl cis-trans isomerase [Vicinamibacterales bacterium]
MLKRLFCYLAVAAIATLYISGAVRAEVIEQVLVKVNGDIVTKSEFERMQVDLLRQRPDLQNVTPDSPELQKAVAESTPQLILNAVDELLLVQRGRELGYVMSDEQFKSVLDNIKKDNNIDTDEKFQEALKQEGMTLVDLRRQLEKNMLETRVQQAEVLAKISVTEDEAHTYYDAHKTEFTTPSEIMLRQILIAVPASDRGVNVAQDDAAKEKAEDIRHRALAGEPFARLAGEVSDDASKANGGLIGPVKSDDIAPALRDALDKLKVGDVTEPIRTQRGYQIFELESRSETKVKTFDEARQDISDKIADLKRRAETQKYVEKLRAAATITWHNDELKKAYEQALAERQKQLQADAAKPAA